MHRALQEAIEGPRKRDRRPPFLPVSCYVGKNRGDRIEQIVLREKKATKAEAKRLEFDKKCAIHAQKTVLVTDAETGESIEISKAVWSRTEGRLSNDLPTILGRGTGKLNLFHETPRKSLLKSSAAASLSKNTSSYSHHGSSIVSAQSLTAPTDSDAQTTSEPSETFQKFMQNGPLNVYFNREWIDVNIPKLSSPEKRELLKIKGHADDSMASTILSRPESAVSRSDGKDADSSPDASPSKNEASLPQNAPAISRASSFSQPCDSSTATTSTQRRFSRTNSSVRPSRRNTADSKKIKAMLPIQSSLEEQLTAIQEMDWSSVEAAMAQEIVSMALYANKAKPCGHRKPEAVIRAQCAHLAYLKAKTLREKRLAELSELVREDRRKDELRACATKAERKTWEEQFAADRKEAAEAMRETQMNNEIHFISAMKEAGLLW